MCCMLSNVLACLMHFFETKAADQRIAELFKVRNQLAHRWNENEFFYRKDSNGKHLTITVNILKFTAHQIISRSYLD